MKKLLFLITFLLCSKVAVAQELLSDSTTILSISTYLRTSGKVAVYQDSRLEELISYRPKAYYVNPRKGKGSDFIVSQGFRIRAFSGNNQVQSKNRVYKIEKDIKDYDPSLATYVVFKSPNWRLLLGNFTTNEEAVTVLRNLKKRFPEYGREMFIVKDEIEIPR